MHAYTGATIELERVRGYISVKRIPTVNVQDFGRSSITLIPAFFSETLARSYIGRTLAIGISSGRSE